MLVIEGLVGFHRTIQLQLLQRYWSGCRFGLLWYWIVCLGNKQKSSVIFEIEPKYCISEVNYFVDYEGPSSKGFLTHSSRFNGPLNYICPFLSPMMKRTSFFFFLHRSRRSCRSSWNWSTTCKRMKLEHFLDLTSKKDVLFIIGGWNTKVGSQEKPGITGKPGMKQGKG